MLEDYRDLDIDELMKGMSEAELLALDEELERDVIQPNPSYSLRAPTPPPPISDDDSRYFYDNHPFFWMSLPVIG